MKRLAVLGSTGSIGQQTLEVVRAFPGRLEITALACGNNITLLKQQADEFKPSAIYHERIGGGEEEFNAEFVSLDNIVDRSDVDIVVVATSGKAGLSATLTAIRNGKTVALANKEVLVIAGEIVMAEARRYSSNIIPVDSEHSAIWQCLNGEHATAISRIVLTASGGPFRSSEVSFLEKVTPEEALRHPTWQMGKKVTIDSATLMNKGMEIIEAHWLFGIPFSQIEVVVHPESIVHSVVEFVDGSSKAHLSMPDMRLPIQYALTYPERWEGPFRKDLDFNSIGSLRFEPVDWERYPCLKLAKEAGARGGTYPAVLSAADETAVELFLDKRIGFLDIPALIARILDLHENVADPTIEDILSADAWAREKAIATI
jgi:1-deoxy-D-xylulose-5-phosphate reductoisomerase